MGGSRVTTATRPAPAHGQDDRCYRAGCRRPECLDAYRNTRKRAELRRAYGIPARANGPRIAAHLNTLLDSGWTRLQIAATSGVSDRGIRNILGGQREVQLSTATALLTVQPLPATPRVNATGSKRRIQALAYAGWPIKDTARAVGCSPDYLFEILNGSVTNMLREVAEAITAYHRTLDGRPGPSNYTRAAARRNQWAPAAAWDDIDDPNATPHTGPEPELGRDELAALRKADVEHLAAYGIDEDEIAERVGLAKSTVHALVEEWRTGTKRDRRKQAVSA
jgi:transcriptional regulator with XRE-family HTH domain